METKRTDKEMLVKGLRRMAISVIMMFAGPTLFYIATTNEEKPLYIPILMVSILMCIGAVLVAIKGLQTIMKSMFGDRAKSN